MGGADVPFSKNGSLNGAFHAEGTTAIIVNTSGDYKEELNVDSNNSPRDIPGVFFYLTPP